MSAVHHTTITSAPSGADFVRWFTQSDAAGEQLREAVKACLARAKEKLAMDAYPINSPSTAPHELPSEYTLISIANPNSSAAVASSDISRSQQHQQKPPLGRYLSDSISPFNLAITRVCVLNHQLAHGIIEVSEDNPKMCPWTKLPDERPSVEQCIMENEETTGKIGTGLWLFVWWLLFTPLLLLLNIYIVPDSYTLLLIIVPPACALGLYVFTAPIFFQPLDTMVRVFSTDLKRDGGELLEADRLLELNSQLQTLLIAVLTNSTVLTTQLQSNNLYFSCTIIGCSTTMMLFVGFYYLSNMWLLRARVLIRCHDYWTQISIKYDVSSLTKALDDNMKRVRDLNYVKGLYWSLHLRGQAWRESYGKDHK